MSTWQEWVATTVVVGMSLGLFVVIPIGICIWVYIQEARFEAYREDVLKRLRGDK